MRHCRLLIIAALGMSACEDQDAAKRADAERAFQEAVSLVAQSERGYRPVGDNDQFAHDSLEEYRQVRVDEAIAELERVIKSPSPVQRQAAHVLLADLNASMARVAQRQGADAWADLANRSAGLIAILVAIDSSNSRAQSLDTDDAPLIRRLEGDRDAVKSTIKDETASLDDLTQRVADLNQQIKQLNDQRQTATDQAQQYREQAFTKSGDARYDLYDNAANADREAFQIATKAEGLRVKLDVYSSEITVLRRRIDSGEKFVGSVDQQIDDTQQRREVLQADVAGARAAMETHIKNLTALIERLAGDYDTKVDAPLGAAVQRVDKALEHIEAAITDAGSDADSVRLEKLGKLLTKVDILTTHVMAQGDLGQKLGVAASRVIEPDYPQMVELRKQFADSVVQVAARQGVLISQAKVVIEQGRILANELAASSDTVVQAGAAAQLDRLNAYDGRLGDLQLPGAQIPAPAESEPPADALSDDSAEETIME